MGTKTEQLEQLRAREAELGIQPDPELDAFLTAAAEEGVASARHNISTEYMLKVGVRVQGMLKVVSKRLPSRASSGQGCRLQHRLAYSIW